MTGNGNDPRLAQLETTLRGAMPTAAAAKPLTEATEQATYDVATRIRDTADAMRALARYSNETAEHLERFVTQYVANMGRLLGRMK